MDNNVTLRIIKRLLIHGCDYAFGVDKSMSLDQSVDDWKQKGLGTRASYVLAKSEIGIAQLANYKNVDALLDIKNCGAETGREIWDFMKNLTGGEPGAIIVCKREGRTSAPSTGIREVSFETLIPNSD